MLKSMSNGSTTNIMNESKYNTGSNFHFSLIFKIYIYNILWKTLIYFIRYKYIY